MATTNTEGESRERSAELLRLAIARMSEHPAPLDPLTYAVWYLYHAGRHPALKAEIDGALERGLKIDTELVRALYLRHVVDAAELATRKVSADLSDMLQDVQTTTTFTGEQVSAFQHTLQAQGEKLPMLGDVQALGATLDELLSGTRSTGESLSQLTSRLQTATQELQQLRRELDHAREQATIDALTGVVNRRGFDEAVGRADTAPPESATSLVLIDIDHFKKINDQYGHLFGDRVLKVVAQAIRACVKGRDLVARYGGEEFAVLLPETSLAGATALAEQIRQTVSAARIRRSGASESIGAITVSLGVAARRSGETLATTLERADAALYRSKNDGRNRVTAVQ